MGINFPASLDTTTQLPQPTTASFTNNPSHAGAHDNESAAIIALETKLGIGSSTPVGTNLLISAGAGASGWTKAAPTGVIIGDTDTQTLTNKTLTSPTINTPNITNATISTDLINGFTAANAGTVFGMPISGGKINSSGIAAGSINYAALLNTIFSGQVLSLTNTGTGGGTMYYINLGGLKLLWGSTGSIATNGASSAHSFTVALPASFFTTIQLVNVTAGGLSTDTSQFANVASQTPTLLSGYLYNITGSAAAAAVAEYFIIGT